MSIYKGTLSPPYTTQHTGPVLSIEAKNKIKETLTQIKANGMYGLRKQTGT